MWRFHEITCYFNFTVIINFSIYAHDNLEQHAIVHVYPSLESKYMNDENSECKIGVLKRYKCNTNINENKKTKDK